MATDILTNQGSGTVTSGGTTAPAQGTSESWTVTAANAFPQVSVAAGTTFKIVDPAQQTEVMMVTVAPGGTGAGQSWTVTRGAEGTTPVVHAANCTVYEIITSGVLGNLASTVAALQPGASPVTIESWHVVTYQNSWTAAGAGFDLKYKLMPDSTVHLTGRLTVPSSPANPSVITALPAAYCPANKTETMTAQTNTSTSPYTAQLFLLLINTSANSGTIAVYGALTAGTTLDIQGRFPLNA
jgi:hypothetical protein